MSFNKGIAKLNILVIISLAVIGIAIYSNTFNAVFHFDDEFAILQNQAIRNLLDPYTIFLTFKTRFITGLTFAYNYWISGYNVVSYHVFNIATHIATSSLIFMFVKILFETPRLENKFQENQTHFIAIFAAFFFLVHPIQTQAVTYIWQRATSLTTLFYLLSLIYYLKSRLYRKEPFFILSFLFGLIAMFTKEIAFTLPITICMSEIILFNKKSRGKKEFIKILFISLLVIVIPATFFFGKPARLGIAQSIDAKKFTSPDNRGSIVDITRGGGSEKMTRLEYVLTETNVWRTYLRLLVFPINQNLDYDYPITRSVKDKKFIGSFLFLLTLLTSLFYFYRHNTLIIFTILFFIITMSVESSVIPIQDVINEHRLYLPMIGFSIFAATILVSVVPLLRMLSFIAFGIIILLSCLTYQRNFVWLSRVSLWEDIVKKSPDKARTHANLSLSYLEEGRYEESMASARRSIELKSDDERLYNHIGVAHERLGEDAIAIRWYQKAIDVAISKNKDYVPAYHNMSVSHRKLGHSKEERMYLEEALKILEKYPYGKEDTKAAILSDLGVYYFKKGSYRKAEELYWEAIELNPNLLQANYNLGMLYRNAGFLDKAEYWFNTCLKIDQNYAPAYIGLGVIATDIDINMAKEFFYKAILLKEEEAIAFHNLGVICGKQKEWEKEINYQKKALTINPDYINAKRRLALAYEKTHQYEQAEELYKSLLDKDPKPENICVRLGQLYAGQERWDEAINYYQKAIQKQPRNSDFYYDIGLLYSKTGKLDEVEKKIEELKKLNRYDLASILESEIQ